MISERKSDYIPTQMKISTALLQSCLKLECCKQHKAACHATNVMSLMMSDYFKQYITGYTVTNF